MDNFTTTVTIERPVHEVWQLLTDWQQAPRWMAGIEGCSAPEGLAVGKTLRFTARGAERQSVVRDVVDQRKLVLESTQGAVVATYTYSCEPRGAGTALTLHAVCRARGPMTLLMPLIRYLMKRVDGGQPAALKRLLESSG